MKFDGEELKGFISSVIESVRSGTASQGCGLTTPIQFELAIISSKKKDVGISIHVVDASSKHSNEVVSKIKFSVARKGSRFERDPESILSQRELRKKLENTLEGKRA
jgi:hypothetical protein